MLLMLTIMMVGRIFAEENITLTVNSLELINPKVVTPKGNLRSRARHLRNYHWCDWKGYKLAMEVNNFRAKNGLSRLPISSSLSYVAKKHTENPLFGHDSQCNLHSWGGNNPCCYTRDDNNPSCMWNKPKEITGNSYRNIGFEISARGFGSNYGAIQGWYGSISHRKVMLSEGEWGKYTRSIGCGVKDYTYHCWFSESPNDSNGICPGYSRNLRRS